MNVDNIVTCGVPAVFVSINKLNEFCDKEKVFCSVFIGEEKIFIGESGNFNKRIFDVVNYLSKHNCKKFSFMNGKRILHDKTIVDCGFLNEDELSSFVSSLTINGFIESDKPISFINDANMF